MKHPLRPLLTMEEIDAYLIKKEKELIQEAVKQGQTIDTNLHMQAYQRELETMHTMEKLELYKHEQYIEKMTEYYNSMHIDHFRFFNMPYAKADFSHYLGHITWSREEAVALCLGKNPEVVNFDTLNEYISNNVDDPKAKNSAFISSYFNIRSKLLSDLSISDREPPLLFLNWFNANKVIADNDLIANVVKFKIISLDEYRWIDEETEAVFSDDNIELNELLHYKVKPFKESQQAYVRKENTRLRVIAALLEFIEGTTEGIQAHPQFIKYTGFVELLSEKYSNNNVKGFSRRNLMALFGLAKKQLKY